MLEIELSHMACDTIYCVGIMKPQQKSWALGPEAHSGRLRAGNVQGGRLGTQELRVLGLLPSKFG